MSLLDGQASVNWVNLVIQGPLVETQSEAPNDVTNWIRTERRSLTQIRISQKTQYELGAHLLILTKISGLEQSYRLCILLFYTLLDLSSKYLWWQWQLAKATDSKKG